MPVASLGVMCLASPTLGAKPIACEPIPFQKTFKTPKLALYRKLGVLTEPKIAHKFC